jgi:hypothetical protein
MYIYSYTKKFLKKRALTTKLIVVTKTDKFYKFVLSSLDNKAVLNMIKETDVSEYIVELLKEFTYVKVIDCKELSMMFE